MSVLPIVSMNDTYKQSIYPTVQLSLSNGFLPATAFSRPHSFTLPPRLREWTTSTYYEHESQRSRVSNDQRVCLCLAAMSVIELRRQPTLRVITCYGMACPFKPHPTGHTHAHRWKKQLNQSVGQRSTNGRQQKWVFSQALA